MSAIFGVLSWNNKPVVREELASMDFALAHHGAEGGGVWLDGTVGLGQRLRSFTPQDVYERQPLIGGDGTLVLVFDGRIDNRPELLGILNKTVYPVCEVPDQIAVIPDSALIMRAYQAWGQDCVSRFVGVFAFAIWDARAKTLFAVRSPIAAPTLMYAATEQAFVFATTPAGLHALPFISRSLNEERLADMLVQMGGSPPETTLYQGISRLPTGWSLTAGQDGVKLRCYWRPDLSREIRFARDEDYEEAFIHLFERVVGNYLNSSTPVAIQMSGGLDSASVAAIAARLLYARGECLTAFTEVPRPGFSGTLPTEKYADETPFVQAIAAMYENLDLNLIRTNGQFFLNDLDRLFPHLEAPFRNTSNRVWIEAIIEETARRGMKVLLDGMQGNLTMSWNGSGLLPGLIRAGKWGQAFGQASTFETGGKSLSTLRTFIGQGVLPLLPDSLWAAIEKLRHPPSRTTKPWITHSPIHPDFAKAQRVPERACEHNYTVRFRPKADTRLLRYDTLANQDFGAYICAYRSMYGVDMRTPPADMRLAEFCLTLPEDQYQRDGRPRRFIRHAMAAYLPEIVLTNRMRGLQAADWFERLIGARDQVAEELKRLEQNDLTRRVLDLPRMRGLFDRMPTDVTYQDDVFMDYQLVLQRGLMVGRFLNWFEAGG